MNALVRAPLEGEILEAGATITVAAAMHPLKQDHRILVMPAGLSITEIVERVADECEVSRLAAGAHVAIDGCAIPRENWHRVRVKPGHHVMVRAVPGKGIGNILMSILTLGLALIAPWLTGVLFPALAVGSLGYTLVTGAIMLGGSMLLRALFPPSQLKGDDTTPSYSISAQKNGASQWGPIPVMLGNARVHPKYAAIPYTEFIGDDQYLRMLFVWGYGPIVLSDLQIGDTPIDQYDDVEIQTFEGWSNVVPDAQVQDAGSWALPTGFSLSPTNPFSEWNSDGFIQYAWSGGSGWTSPALSEPFPVIAGKQYLASFEHTGAGSYIEGTVIWYDASDNIITGKPVYHGPSSSAANLPVVTATAPAGAIAARFAFYVSKDQSTANAYFGAPVVRRKSFADEPLDGKQTIYPSEVVQNDLNIKVSKENSPYIQTSAEDADEIILDLTAPSGIYWISGHGHLYANQTIPITVNYRKAGTEDDWVQLGVVDMKANGKNPVRKSARFTVAKDQYDVQLVRTYKDYGGDGPTDGQSSFDIYWTALKSVRIGDPPIEFGKPLAITALRIRATEQLNGTIDNLSGIASSPAMAWDGSEWVPNTETRNPADLMRIVLQGPANARAQPDSRLDLPTIEAFAEHCTSKGFTFDMYRDFTASVRDTLKDVCAAGRGVPLFRDGKWSVAWEETDAPIVQHFTPRNSRDFSWSQTYQHFPHGLRCKFVNRTKDYVEDEILVFDEGYDKSTATLYEQVEFPGITDPAQIYKMAKYRIADAKQRPATYKLTVDFEHLIAQRGDRVVAAYDVIEVGLASGRVQAVDGQEITLDEPAVMEAGKNYGLRVRRDDGTSTVLAVTNDPGTQSVITVTGTAPEAGDLYTFGLSGQETGTYRILAIKPGEDLSAEIDLVDDGNNVQDADSDTDIPPGSATAPADLTLYAPRNPRVVQSDIVVDGVRTRLTNFSWSQPGGLNLQSFQVVATESAGQQIKRTVPSSQLYETFEGMLSGTWTFKVRALIAGWATPFSPVATLTINIADEPPDDVTGFKIAILGDSSTLSWDSDPSINHDHYVIRYSPETSGATWASAAVQLSHVDATSVQIPTRPGSYLIKAVSQAGLESVNEAVITSTAKGVPLNAVETFVEEPDWTGTKTDTEVQNDELRLATDTAGTAVTASSGTYQSATTIDLGQVYTSRLTPTLAVRGVNLANVMANWMTLSSVESLSGSVAASWSAVIEMRMTSDDPSGSPTWSDWQDATTGDFTARAYQMRVSLASTLSNVTPAVGKAELIVDMPDRVIGENDLAVPTTGLRIDFEPPYKALKGLAISAQGLATGDYYEITSKDRTGFDIVFKDAADAAIARTFDYVASGYGRVVN